MRGEVADNLAKSIGISRDQVVREEYEMIVLKALFEREVGSAFVFKGGTGLRLAYGSPRFSEDLDFSVVKDFKKAKVDSVLKAVANLHKALSLVETRQKKYTYFALFRVEESFLHLTFSIKFEASTRPVNWKKNRDYELRTLTSRVTSLTVLAQVATLQQIEQEKITIQPLRIRDIFDLWFIGQRLGKPTQMDFGRQDAKVVKRELHKFLPEGERKLLEQWLAE